MRRLALITRAAMAGGLVLAAAGSIEGTVRLWWDPSLRDCRGDAFQFVCWGIAINALLGAILGAAYGLIRGMFAPGAGGRHSRLTPVVLCCVALIPIVACAVFFGRLMGGKAAPADASSIVLITVDTLRADALDVFRNGGTVPAGLERARTPHLNKFAGGSWVFLDASTPIPKTPQAISSLMTGNYPGRHGLRNLFETLGADNVTLAEILREHGWTTHAVITNGLIDRPSGIGQGFDVYRPRDGLRAAVKSYLVVQLCARLSPRGVRFILNRFPALRITAETASAVTDRAVAALDELSGRPYFLWVHYLDPHWPYQPPEPWMGQTDTMPAAPLTIYDDLRTGKVNIGEMIHDNKMPPAEVERLASLYAGETNYLDGEVGRLIEAVGSSAGSSSTIIVFTSDHGESLGEHRYYFSHGDQVYQPSMRVPLIIQVPGAGARTIESPVGLADITPTILDLARIPLPSELDGVSILPRVTPETAAAHAGDAHGFLFGESDISYLKENPWVTIPGEAGKVRYVRQGPWKLVRYPRDIAAARRFDETLGTVNEGLVTPLGSNETTKLGVSSPDIIELFDLGADPSELNDLSKKEAARATAMTHALDAWLISRLAPAGSQRPDEKELLEQLKSLGYVN